MTLAPRRLRQVASQASQPSLICKVPEREPVTKQTTNHGGGIMRNDIFWLTSGLQTHVCMHVCAHSSLRRRTNLPILYSRLQKTASLISEHLEICQLQCFTLKQPHSSLVSEYCSHTNEARNGKTIFPHCLKWQALLN